MHANPCEQITPSGYEDLAVALASDRAWLQNIRSKLQRNVPVTPLFDTDRFARHIEAAYVMVTERHLAGLPPDHIVVSDTLPAATP